MTFIALALSLLLAPIPATGHRPPSPEIPPILLAAPINATWAANTAAQWRARGFSGFLFEGIADSLPSPGTPKGLAAARLRLENPLLRTEIDNAQRRLREAGIGENFLHVYLQADEKWFADPKAQELAQSFFGAAGAFCKAAGLRGLALDTDAESAIFQRNWEGYKLDDAAQRRIEAGARGFARRCLRAFIRECPQAQFLILADSVRDAGALWFPFFAGCIEAPGAAETVQVHLVARDLAQETNPGAIASQAAALRRCVAERMPADVAEDWLNSGRLSFAAAPLGYDDGKAAVYSTPEEFRLQMAATTIYSDSYACVDAPGGGWWDIPEVERAQYAGLLQAGRAAVASMPAPHPDWAHYTLAKELTGLMRVGPFQHGGDSVFVLHGKSGSAAVFWNGLAKPLELPSRFALISATHLHSGQRTDHVPREGTLSVPANPAPLLLEGLPASDWTLPASLWLDTDTAPAAGESRLPVHFGLRNFTPEMIDGGIELIAPADFSVGQGHFAVKLGANAETSFARTLQGIFRTGSDLKLSLQLMLPGRPPITRDVQLAIAPEQHWAAPLGGLPAPGGPVLLPAHDGPLIVTADDAGEVAAFAPDGTRAWTHLCRDAVVAGPVVWRIARDTFGIAIADRGGFVHLIGEDGKARWEKRVGRHAAIATLCTGDVFANDYDALIAASADGRVLCVHPGGALLWEKQLGGSLYLCTHDAADAEADVRELAKATRVAQRIFVATVNEGAGALYQLDPMGNIAFRTVLAAPPSAAPILVPLPGGSEFGVLVGEVDGTAELLHARHGLLFAQWKGDAAIGFLTHAVLGPGKQEDAIVVGESGVHALELALRQEAAEDDPLPAMIPERFALRPRWHTPLPGARAATPCMAEGAPALAVTGAPVGLWLLDMAGKPLWSDPRPFGVPAGPALAGGFTGEDGAQAAYTGDDRMLRLMALTKRR